MLQGCTAFEHELCKLLSPEFRDRYRSESCCQEIFDGINLTLQCFQCSFESGSLRGSDENAAPFEILWLDAYKYPGVIQEPLEGVLRQEVPRLYLFPQKIASFWVQITGVLTSLC